MVNSTEAILTFVPSPRESVPSRARVGPLAKLPETPMTPTPLPDESHRAFAAFKAYCADPKRSIRRCARKLHKSPTIIARWSKKHRWQTRLRELELEDCKRAVKADEQA